MNNHTTSCDGFVAEFVIERYAAGKLSKSETVAFEEHLLVCDRCQRELTLAVAIRESVSRDEPMKMAEKSRRRFTVFLGTALAAAATIAVVMVLPSSRSAHRSDDTVLPAAPEPVSPIGDVMEVDQLTWRRSPGVNRYRLVLLDAEGSIVWGGETVDSFVSIPADVEFKPGEPYYWKVDARIGFDRWVPSDFATFTLRPASAAESR